jgi:hypothetical protein
MSYCVNCGVELEAALKSCPLCGTEVINPKKEEAPSEKRSLPEIRDEYRKVDRVFWINFISLLVVVPIATCLICDMLYNESLTWSLYVVAGVEILWAFSISPFLFKKFSYIKMVSADMAGVLIGLFFLELLSPAKGWLLEIALPLVVYCYLAWLLILWLTKKKLLRRLAIGSSYALAIGVMVIFLEVLLDLASSSAVTLTWSWFIIAPCLSVAALLLLLDHNKRVKQELKKRLHV